MYLLFLQHKNECTKDTLQMGLTLDIVHSKAFASNYP